MHGDGGGEGGKGKEGIEEDGDGISHSGCGCKGFVEDVWQGDEDERGARIGLHTDGEGGGENHQSGKYGDEGVEQGDLCRRPDEIGLAAEIGSIGTQAGGAETEGEESLAERLEEDAVRQFGEVGLEEELHPLHRTGQHACRHDEHDEDDKQRGHEELGCLLNALANAPCHDKMGEAYEAHRPHGRPKRVGGETLEVVGHIGGIAAELAGE